MDIPQKKRLPGAGNTKNLSFFCLDYFVLLFRICRPGSIVGPQQQFLVSIEQKMFYEGQVYREKSKGMSPTTISSTGSGVTDGAEGSGRTTPNIFQNAHGSQKPSASSGRQLSFSFFLHLDID